MGDLINEHEKVSIFYIYPRKEVKNLIGYGRRQIEKGNEQVDKSNSIPVKYLLLNGKPLQNPYLAKGFHIDTINYYRSLDSKGKIDETSVFKNSNGYLIVPANFDLDEALPFAKEIKKLYEGDHFWDLKSFMKATFADGGKLDIQRGITNGAPPNEFDPAAVGSASFVFGVTSEVSGLPEKLSEFGGGWYNLKRFKFSSMTFPYGMSRQDTENFEAGFAWAKAQMDDPNSAFHKQAKAFGLDTSFKPKPSSPLAPRGRFVLPQKKANGSNNAGSEDSGAEKPSPHALNGALYLPFMVNMPAALAWLGEMGFASGGVNPHKNLSWAPLRGVSATGPAESSKPSVNWYSQELAGGRAKSRAPRAVGLRARSERLTSLVMQNGGAGSTEIAPTKVPVLRRENKYAPTGMRRPLSTQTYFGTDGKVVRGEPSEWDNGFITHDEFGRLLEDYLNRQARLPPRGATGFDPRLSPAWAGLKLPN